MATIIIRFGYHKMMMTILSGITKLLVVFEHPDHTQPIGTGDWHNLLWPILGIPMNRMEDRGIAGWWFFVILIGWFTYREWKEYLTDKKKIRDRKKFRKKWNWYRKYWIFSFTVTFCLAIIVAIARQLFFFQHGYFGEWP